MSQSIPDKQTMADLWQAVKDRSIPLKSLTKAEYDVLDEVQKNSDVLYVIESVDEFFLVYRGEELASSTDIPVRFYNQSQWDSLNEDERNKNLLSIVDEAPWVPVPLSFQEYDTEDGWHVRKCSDGYAEVTYIGTHSNWSGWTNGIWAGYPIVPDCPIAFIGEYSSLVGVESIQTVGLFIPGSYKPSNNNISIASSQGSGICRYTLRITGRWR